MNDIPQITELVEVGHELIDDYRGGAVARMKAEHEQTLQTLETEKQEALGLFVSDKNQALDAFNQEKSAAFAKADSELSGRRAAVDAVLGDLSGHVIHKTHYYDSAIHSKNSLGLIADPSDETVSEWVKVPISADLPGWAATSLSNKLTVIYLKRALSYNGGYPEYVTDKSRSLLQFAVASIGATSEHINQELAAKELTLSKFGGWNNGTSSGEVHTLQIAGLNSYKCLWVRAINIPYQDGEIAQNIEQFGGNCSFSVDKVVNFTNIAK